MFSGPFSRTNCLDLKNFGLRDLGLKAEDSRPSIQCREKKNAGGHASRDFFPGRSVNVLVALGSPGSGLALLAR